MRGLHQLEKMFKLMLQLVIKDLIAKIGNNRKAVILLIRRKWRKKWKNLNDHKSRNLNLKEYVSIMIFRNNEEHSGR